MLCLTSIIAAVDVKIFWLRDRTNDHPIVHSHQCEMQTHENAMLSLPFSTDVLYTTCVNPYQNQFDRCQNRTFANRTTGPIGGSNALPFRSLVMLSAIVKGDWTKLPVVSIKRELRF